MSGQQADFAVRGSRNEDAAQQLIGRIAAYSKVPREHDYGIDFYCQVREPNTVGTAFTVGDLFAVQVKGASDLIYGGRNDRGEWKSHEVEWLRALGVPLYLVQVDPSLSSINWYSLGPVWRVLWKTQPFQIRCTTEPGTDAPWVFAEATCYPASGTLANATEHDGQGWTVPLGPPFLRLTNEDLSDPTFAMNAKDCLRKWAQIDRRNLIRFQLRVAIIDTRNQWYTNDFASPAVANRALFWNSLRGANVPALAALAAEVLANLGLNLQSQNDLGAYSLIEALEYLDALHVVDDAGKGLLRGLKEAKARGLAQASQTVS